MSDDGYKVGKGRPPKHTQFKPGQSGHPPGRPKGVRNLRSDLAAEFSKVVRVTENGRTLKVTKQQLMIKTLYAKAAKGDVRALIKLFDLHIQHFGGAVEPTSDDKSLPADDEAVIEAALARRKGGGGGGD
jgi:hypothetical protein